MTHAQYTLQGGSPWDESFTEQHSPCGQLSFAFRGVPAPARHHPDTDIGQLRAGRITITSLQVGNLTAASHNAGKRIPLLTSKDLALK